ncbi:hypothetical protein [Streptomyces sp. SAS_270]|uniref:hypothetical protein n=1 Tax=Streptomyces sp. SAS_270 TaxID=3412748 RepID=UPI00403D1A8A
MKYGLPHCDRSAEVSGESVDTPVARVGSDGPYVWGRRCGKLSDHRFEVVAGSAGASPADCVHVEADWLDTRRTAIESGTTHPPAPVAAHNMFPKRHTPYRWSVTNGTSSDQEVERTDISNTVHEVGIETASIRRMSTSTR